MAASLQTLSVVWGAAHVAHSPASLSSDLACRICLPSIMSKKLYYMYAGPSTAQGFQPASPWWMCTCYLTLSLPSFLTGVSSTPDSPS